MVTHTILAVLLFKELLEQLRLKELILLHQILHLVPFSAVRPQALAVSYIRVAAVSSVPVPAAHQMQARTGLLLSACPPSCRPWQQVVLPLLWISWQGC